MERNEEEKEGGVIMQHLKAGKPSISTHAP